MGDQVKTEDARAWRRRLRRTARSLLTATLGALVLLAAVSAESAFANFGYLSQFGSSGSGQGQFSAPWAVAVDPANAASAVVGNPAAPTVTGVSPSSGPATGGFQVTITGTPMRPDTSQTKSPHEQSGQLQVSDLKMVSATCP